MKPVISPKELAQAIGVSESSVKRWVDAGRLRATKTIGGHRKIPASEAVRFIRENRAVLIDPRILGLTELEQETSQGMGAEADRLFDLLRSGAGAEARALLLSMYLSGSSVAEIVDGPVATAMSRIGELWVDQPSGVFWEHRATDIAIQGISRLRSLLTPEADAPLAVGGAPSGDPYILPSLAAATVLEDSGLQAVNLGPETPLATLALAVDELDADLAWISISAAEEPRSLERDLDRLLRRLERRRVPLVVGGSQHDQITLPRSDEVLSGPSMLQLEALVRGFRLATGRSRATGD